MEQRDGKLVVPMTPSTGCLVVVWSFFALFGLALVGLWLFTVLYPDPGATSPAWRVGLVGVAWLLVCVLGVATRHTITIDPARREVELRITRFGLGRGRVVPFRDFRRIGLTAYGTWRGPRGYRLLLDGVGGTVALHTSNQRERLRDDARTIAAAMDLEFVDATAASDARTD